MRKLLVLLLLALSALWLYASWYWYTCIIKGFCSTTEVVMVDNKTDIGATPSDLDKPTERKIVEVKPEPVVDVKQDDVEVAPKQEETPAEPITIEEKKECEILITTPIKLGSQNDSGDVKDLEDFLNAFEGESLEVNGIYEQVDVEAVKRLQLKYASEVLTPWGIKNPTGYVYKTTTKKINDIYCGK